MDVLGVSDVENKKERNLKTAYRKVKVERKQEICQHLKKYAYILAEKIEDVFLTLLHLLWTSCLSTPIT